MSAIAGIQGALYLLVLSVNSVVSFTRGFVAPPGELPLWATLGVVVGAAAGVLVTMAGPRPEASTALAQPGGRPSASSR